jgi:tetratricopeptide (TPR) repeat protein
MKMLLRSTGIALFSLLLFVTASNSLQRGDTNTQSNTNRLQTQVSLSPTLQVKAIPTSHVIAQQTHIYQSFNNCGPASLSMLFSYNGMTVSQEELGQKLRPYQNAAGIDDDKSVTIEELATEAESHGLKAYHRRNGSLHILKQLIANDIPVLVRTWLNPDEDIGHYRIVRGFNDTTQKLLQDDSYQGDNLEYDYEIFEAMWQPFNYEYMVIVVENKSQLITTILKENANEKVAWENALQRAEKESKTATSVYPVFNKVVALTHVGRYDEAVAAFEAIEASLPPRMLWYQIEPIEAYLQTKQYDKVFAMTNHILNNNNRGYAELYILQGNAHQALGDMASARTAYENAVFYNEQLQAAHQALATLPTQ